MQNFPAVLIFEMMLKILIIFEKFKINQNKFMINKQY